MREALLKLCSFNVCSLRTAARRSTLHQATLQPSKRLSHDQEKNVSKAKSRRLHWAGTKAADSGRSQIYRYKKHGLTGTQRREECREKRSSLWQRPTDLEESTPVVVASPPPIMARIALAGDARPDTGRRQVGWASTHRHRGFHTRGQPKGRSCAESLLKGQTLNGNSLSTATPCAMGARASWPPPTAVRPAAGALTWPRGSSP